MSLEIQNDMRKIERNFEILNNLGNITYQTEVGQEVYNTIKAAVMENIRHYLLEKHKQLKKQL